jgi:hypothetical protein
MKIRVSIRDIIFLTLLVACNLGWYITKVAPTRMLEGQVEMLEGQVEIGNRLNVVTKVVLLAERGFVTSRIRG